MEDFLKIAEILASWPAAPSLDGALSDAACDRLRRALVQFRNGGLHAPGPGDLASLIYHVVRRAHLFSGGPISFRVPCESGWPDEKRWAQYQVKLSKWADGWAISEACPWSPKWLEGADCFPPYDDAILEKKYAFVQPSLPIDPCLEKQLGGKFEKYLSPGQAKAVRAICLAKPGSTSIVVLPTGSGKSLVAYAAAVCDPSDSSLTLIVTPTVALALNQSHRWREIAAARVEDSDHPSCWHSGTSESDRKTIVDAIREGRQRILFTSPEAVVTYLSGPLTESAGRGFLRNIIIDEAHMVAAWGDDFRPEFQSIAAARRHLLRTAREMQRPEPRTILMTATLVDESLEALRNLFTEEDRWSLVGAVHLRPEPRYWMARASGSAQREEWLLDAIRHAPRCFILYVTKKDHALTWSARLRREGFSRVALFTGDTEAAEREKILLNWSSGNLDAVVATSAFGLGVDKSDVRCVLHSCVPETLDRYYQEVGRGGRDGAACTSILVSEPNDLQVAESLSSPMLIGVDKGYIRWNTMRLSAKRSNIHSASYRFDLKLVPAQLHAESKGNRSWNLKTLLLMARAGMIRLDLEPWKPPERKDGELIERYRDRVAAARRNFADHVVVEYLSGGFTARHEWEVQVEESRRRTYRSRSSSLKSLLKLIRGLSSHEEMLASIYSLPDYGLAAAALCAGCPSCRKKGISRLDAGVPVPTNSSVVRSELTDDRLSSLFLDSGLLLVEYDSLLALSSLIPQISDFLQRAVAGGISEIIVSAEWKSREGSRIKWNTLHENSEQSFLAITDPKHFGFFGEPLPVPRLWLIPPGMEKARIPNAVFENDASPQILLYPSSGDNFSREARRLLSLAQSQPLAEVISRLKT